jgi:hypothetical protein
MAPPQEKRCLPFAITLPTFAEAWEYDEEDKDGMTGDGHKDLVDTRRHALALEQEVPSRGGEAKSVGALEKKASTTYIAGEVVTGKGSQRDVKVRGC